MSQALAPESIELFRAVNERILALEPGSIGDADFICECADVRCARVMRMTLHEYEATRSEPALRAVLPATSNLSSTRSSAETTGSSSSSHSSPRDAKSATGRFDQPRRPKDGARLSGMRLRRCGHDGAQRLPDVPCVQLGRPQPDVTEEGGGAVTASGVEVAPPSEGELTRLYDLARATFGDVPGWSDRRVLEVLEHDLVFVARERTRQRVEPAGYVALRREPEAAAVVVEQLFVAPGHEQRGIGHRLLAYAEGYAISERAHALRIVAEETNWRARSFYRRRGFVPVERELLELVLPRAD